MVLMWLLLAVVLIFATVGYDTMAGNMILFHKLGGIDAADRFFSQPRHGAIVRAVNFVGRLLHMAFGLHFGPLNADKLLQNARKQLEKEGLDGRVVEDIEAPLRLFVAAVRASYAGEGAASAPRFSTFGCLSAWNQATEWLENRISLARYIHEHPDVLMPSEELDGFGPIVILGLPRTGTTLLHLLISLDPRSRSFAPWEMVKVTPPACKESYASDARVDLYAERMRATDKLMPGPMDDIRANHISGPLMPEECIMLHSNSFHSAIFAMALRDEEYHQFVHFNVEGVTRMMDYHRLQLQVLMHRYKPSLGGHVVLKAPCYSLWIDQLRRVYPACKIIMTHRDPVGVVASTAKILHPVNELFLEACDLRVEAQTAQRICSEYMDHAWRLREELEMPFCSRRQLNEAADRPVAQHMDVHISEMKDDAIGVVEDIYRHFGLGPVLPEHRLRMEDILEGKAKLQKEPAPSTSGIAYHRLETWGLKEEDLKEAFKDYRQLLAQHYG